MSITATETGENERDERILVLMEALFSVVAAYDLGGGDMETMMYAIEAFTVGAVSECGMDVVKKRAMANTIRDMILDRVRLDS